MNKKQPKKKPIKVQLPKDDLKELLVVLKDFMAEEIFVNYKLDTNHRMDCHNRRITELERCLRQPKIERVSLCSHEDRFKSVWYSSRNLGGVLGLHYECIRCKRIITKPTLLLSWREKRVLRKLGVKI